MQFLTSLSCGKTPLDLDLMSIAGFLPWLDHSLHPLHRRQALGEALTSKDRQFNLCHIEPTPMLGGIVKLQTARDATSLFWLEGLIQRSRRMDSEIIQDDPDLWRVGEMHIDQILHRRCEIVLGAPLGNLDVAPAKRGFQEQEEITGALSLILIVHPFALSRLGRQRVAHLIEHLIGTFVKANSWRVGIYRFGIQMQHLFHVPHKVASYRRDAPLLLLPWFEHVFFSMRRTVSSLISSTMPTSTNRSASHCIVHLTWSPGGVLQESAIRYASPFSESLRGTPGRGRSLRASSSPPSTYFLRVRSTVERPTPKAEMISASGLPSLAKRRIWARANLRAAMVPFLVNSLMWWRSSSLSVTTYCFFGTGRSYFFRSTLPFACLSVKFFVAL
jgi:hypothetical protein